MQQFFIEKKYKLLFYCSQNGRKNCNKQNINDYENKILSPDN
jgi:hypothetical protein